jgi:hypothetical protein
VDGAGDKAPPLVAPEQTAKDLLLIENNKNTDIKKSKNFRINVTTLVKQYLKLKDNQFF